MSRENIINIIFMISVSGLVFSIWSICVILWLGQYLTRLKTVQKRLGIAKKENDASRTLRLWREIYKDTESLKPLQKETLKERLERLRNDAGWHASIQTVILGVIGIAILAFVIVYILGGGIPLGLSASAIYVALFSGYTKRRISKRADLFERQLIDALGIAARALRAGHPLIGAFRLVSEEIADPLKTVFFQICQEQSMGLDLKDSIRKVADTTHNTELKLFATAVAIQLESGGNLAVMIDSLAAVIRARMRLNRRVRVITAQTQLSKRILIGLPILLFVILNIISPDYMQPLYATSTGRLMLLMTITSVLLGSWTMSRISVLRF